MAENIVFPNSLMSYRLITKNFSKIIYILHATFVYGVLSVEDPGLDHRIFRYKLWVKNLARSLYSLQAAGQQQATAAAAATAAREAEAAAAYRQ